MVAIRASVKSRQASSWFERMPISVSAAFNIVARRPGPGGPECDGAGGVASAIRRSPRFNSPLAISVIAKAVPPIDASWVWPQAGVSMWTPAKAKTRANFGHVAPQRLMGAKLGRDLGLPLSRYFRALLPPSVLCRNIAANARGWISLQNWPRCSHEPELEV